MLVGCKREVGMIWNPCWEMRAVDNAVGHFNTIWQGDANADALRAFEFAQTPPVVLNVTGLETASVEETARKMGRLMGRKVSFTGKPGDRCYLSDASKMACLLGRPRMPLDDMIRLQAQWIMNGGASIGIPTHFEVSNGRF